MKFVTFFFLFYLLLVPDWFTLIDKFDWNFDDAKETKELNLTHNLIADKAGFRTLMDVYDDDPVIGLKTDILRKIKDNKKNNVPEVAINEDDSFDTVVDKFQLRNRQRLLKKDILLFIIN